MLSDTPRISNWTWLRYLAALESHLKATAERLDECTVTWVRLDSSLATDQPFILDFTYRNQDNLRVMGEAMHYNDGFYLPQQYPGQLYTSGCEYIGPGPDNLWAGRCYIRRKG